jgi:hypothetical protein
MFTPVTPDLAQPPGYGLVPTVGVTDDGDNRWVNGMAWRPETCFPAWTTSVCANEPQASQGGADGSLVYYRPIGLHVETLCSTKYNDPTEDEARARRMLTAATSYLLANELWLGTETLADTYDTPTGDTGVHNAYLASADANVITGSFDPYEALGLLEETAQRAGLGQDVHLHVPRALMAQFGQILEHRGRQLYTHTGALVISDAGYTGSGPAGQPESPTAVWMYATAPVQVRLSDITVETVHEWANNRRLVVAERAGAATFDPCVHFAISTTLPGSTP